MIPNIGDHFKSEEKTVRVTRVTSPSGAPGADPSKEYRWIYYKNTITKERHCQRLDLFLSKYK
jgi:hypothetical protein